MRLRSLPTHLLVVLLIAACTAASPRLGADGSPSAEPGGLPPVTSWQLEAAVLDDRPLVLVPGHRVTLVFEIGRISGTSACNHYGGSVHLAGGSFRIGEMSMTAMGCEEPVLALEAAYTTALGRVTEIELVDDRLVLAGAGVQLRFLPLAAPALEGIVDRVWRLEQVVRDGLPRAPLGGQATLELRADGTLSGSTGARTLAGRYAVRGDELVLTELAADGDDAPPALADQDSDVISVIEGGFVPRLVEGKLILSSEGNEALIYVPAD